MDQAQIIGTVVIGTGTVLTILVSVNNLTKPLKEFKDGFIASIGELKIAIQELKDCVSGLKEMNSVINKRLEKHGEEIDELKRRVDRLDTKMNMYHQGGK